MPTGAPASQPAQGHTLTGLSPPAENAYAETVGNHKTNTHGFADHRDSSQHMTFKNNEVTQEAEFSRDLSQQQNALKPSPPQLDNTPKIAHISTQNELLEETVMQHPSTSDNNIIIQEHDKQPTEKDDDHVPNESNVLIGIMIGDRMGSRIQMDLQGEQNFDSKAIGGEAQSINLSRRYQGGDPAGTKRADSLDHDANAATPAQLEHARRQSSEGLESTQKKGHNTSNTVWGSAARTDDARRQREAAEKRNQLMDSTLRQTSDGGKASALQTIHQQADIQPDPQCLLGAVNTASTGAERPPENSVGMTTKTEALWNSGATFGNKTVGGDGQPIDLQKPSLYNILKAGATHAQGQNDKIAESYSQRRSTAPAPSGRAQGGRTMQDRLGKSAAFAYGGIHHAEPEASLSQDPNYRREALLRQPGHHSQVAFAVMQNAEVAQRRQKELRNRLEVHERKKLQFLQAPSRYGLKFKNKSEEERYLKICSKIMQLDVLDPSQVQRTYDQIKRFLAEYFNAILATDYQTKVFANDYSNLEPRLATHTSNLHPQVVPNDM